MVENWRAYPLVMTNCSLLKIAIEIEDLPIQDADFPVRYVNVCQRVKHAGLYPSGFSGFGSHFGPRTWHTHWPDPVLGLCSCDGPTIF